MKIAVFSDSHGQGWRINEVLSKLAEIDCLVFVGDKFADLKDVDLDELGVVAVRGNHTFNPDLPREKLVEIAGQKIFVTHGDNYSIKRGLNSIYYRAQELEADIVIFGHTHSRFIKEEEGILFFNPGSISLPRDGAAPAYGIIEISDGNITAEHYDFTKEDLKVRKQE
ncbi:metallophosphoesterase [Natroniella sulfidigena]|uniref:metallophosphoesterase family protein n=1 Tax=Natroniella sulfidigena TaxID=723921 RepID=UPI00200B59E5|nr:metallophosphoesterase [Natroniella sulfidigena]MCK8815841.1 metallophosphoesterase [Natroniella sulfidigena]